MNLFVKHSSLLYPRSLLIFLIFVYGFLPHGITTTDNTNLVYKGCASKNFEDPTGVYAQNLKALFSSLVAQSGKKSFASTTSGDDQNAILGLYQCRGDLSNSDCYNCVSKIPDMVDKLCGESMAARIQLNGCYLRYEIAGFKQVSGTELLYKVCRSNQASATGFQQIRETAFGIVESGVKNGGSLFYTGSYQSLYMLGQCEGDLAGNDCGDCVRTAADKAKAECGYSISAQIYLHKCYISYTYYLNGVPDISSSSSGQHAQRTVALVVGGFAALSFAIVCLLFLKSAFKKRGGKR